MRNFKNEIPDKFCTHTLYKKMNKILSAFFIGNGIEADAQPPPDFTA